MYIPDPVEMLESRISSQIDLVDENNTYPCCHCGRRYDLDDMFPVSGNPDAPLECVREDCEQYRIEQKQNKSMFKK